MNDAPSFPSITQKQFVIFRGTIFGNSGSGWNMNLQKNTIKGVPYQTDTHAIKLWKRLYPWLQESGTDWLLGTQKRRALEYHLDEGEKPKNHQLKVFHYQHTSGNLNSGDRGIQWCDVEVKQLVAIPRDKIPEDHRNEFQPYKNGRLMKTFVGVIRTISSSRHDYIISWDYQTTPAEEPEPPEDDDGTGSQNDVTPYQDICEYIYKNTRSTPWEGSISLIPSSQRPFVGRRVSILNARPEWQNLNTIIQSVSRDLLTGETSLTCGPPAYLGIQELADLYNNANRTSQSSSDMADTPGGPEPTESSNSGKRPEAPTIPPMSRTVENATMAWDFTCQVKPYNDEDGNIAGFYVKVPKVNAAGRGWVQTCTDKRDSDGWVLLEGSEITEIYLNVRYKTNSLTELESSSITKEKQYSTDWPVHVGNIPKDSPEWQPDDPPTYSILIATISDDTITIHACGDIVLYLEVDDTLIANVNGGMLNEG